MPAFDTLQRASFAGIEYPVSECYVTGGIRDHIHEYPHTAGGSVEKMGRKLYVIKMKCPFHATFRAYPGLWPSSLFLLRTKWEAQLTDSLVIPTIGTIKAFCRNWTQQTTKGVLSGESVDLEYVEDQGSDDLVDLAISPTITRLASEGKKFFSAKVLADFESEADISIFDLVTNAVNAVLAIGDLANLASGLVSAKLMALTDLCRQADQTFTANNYMNFPLIDALHSIYDTANGALSDLQTQRAIPQHWIVPATMAMSAISTQLYGDNSHTIELLQINPVEDAFAVPAGTNITYIVAGSGASAANQNKHGTFSNV